MKRKQYAVGACACLAALLMSVAYWAREAAPVIHVQWVSGLTVAQRVDVEGRLSLLNGEHLGERSWSYVLADTSSANVRALVQHPAVDDTHEVDRRAFTVSPTAPRSGVIVYRVPCARAVPWLFWPPLPAILMVVALVLGLHGHATRLRSAAWPSWIHATVVAVPPLLVFGAVGFVLLAAAFGFHPMRSIEELTLPEAAALRDRARIMTLIDSGHDPNARDRVRAGVFVDRELHLTPIEAAIGTREIGLVRYLLEYGATIDEAARPELICLADNVGASEIREFLSEQGLPAVSPQECDESATWR